MKILHIVRSMDVGGLESVVIGLVEGMGSFSHETDETHEIVSYLGCLYGLGAHGNDVSVDGKWVGRLDSVGFLKTLISLCRYIRKNQIDLIHTHNPQPHLFGVLAGLLCRVPVVHTKHGRNYPDDKKRVWLNRQLSRFSKKIVAVSDDVADVAIDVEKVPDKKVIVIRNGIDTGKFNRGKHGRHGKRRETWGEEVIEGEVLGSSSVVLGRGGGGFEQVGNCLHPDACRGPDWGYIGKVTEGTKVGEGKGEEFEQEVTKVTKVGAEREGSGFEQEETEGTEEKPKKITIGTVGRLSEDKDYPMLVRAFALLRKKLSPLHSSQSTLHSALSTDHTRLLFVGDGEDRDRIEQEVTKVTKKCKCLDIEFAGMQNNVEEWLQKMDIFCLSSVTEGTSMTLLEAGASGLPGVVTDVGGNREIVADGITGFVVPAGDEKAFAEALLKLVKEPEMRVRFGNAAWERICKLYSVKSMVREYVRVYEESGEWTGGS